jgi:hypothetical protein
MASGTEVAVLTGDLVGSTRLSDHALAAAFEALSDAAEGIARWPPLNHPTFLTRHRGDGWQMLVRAPEYGLRAALVVAATLRALSVPVTTRTAIGIGHCDFIGSGDLSDARGDAFVKSGRRLQLMGRQRMLAQVCEGAPSLQTTLIWLIEARIRRWTQPQAEALALYLHPDAPSMEQVAPALGVTPQAVGLRLRATAAVPLRTVLNEWEGGFRYWRSTGQWAVSRGLF